MDLETAQTIVLETLHKASNQNPDILKPAESKLREWETQPGFYSILFNVISNHTIDINVRWIAVLYFKNGIDKYWRKNAPNAISEEEKVSLRRGLISNFHEPVNQIALQLAVLVSKVARFDCPREWPELVPTLLAAIDSQDSLTQHRALLMLHHVMKQLSSKRLTGDRKLFQELTGNIYTFILNLWNNYTEIFIRHIQQNSSVEIITENLEKALLTLRILRKLTVHGFKKPHESTDAVCFMNVIFERAKSALECRKQLRGKGIYLLELCEKFIIHLTKILIAVLDTHPFSYVDLIQPTLEFTVYYLFTSDGAHLLYERFIIQCFNLIKGILLCAEYKPAKVIEMTQDSETLRAHQIKMNFFQPNTLAEMCRKLVSHYFLLKQDDLEMWDADPETFATDECGESWKYSLRPSTETVFVTLFHEFRQTLAPVLLEMINASHGLVSPTDLPAILHKDAIYSAAGLAAFDLYDEINFDQWFSLTLIQELKVKDNNYRIIRRRVVWLIGVWTSIKLSQELRPILYDTLLMLLQPNEDMAVRLAASTTLRHAVDAFEFNCEQFFSYLEPSFSLLFNLLKEAHECDTKMHVLNVLSLIVERVGLSIRPHADSLMSYLPLLWIESEEHNMLRCAIVSTLVQLVKALGAASLSAAGLSDFLLSVIRLGTDIKQNAVVYLLEDCLELWLAVLENSQVMSDELIILFDNIPALMEDSTENLRMNLSIAQAHILLSPERTLIVQGPALINVCDSMISDLNSDGIIILMRLLETCLRAAPQISPDILKPILPRIFDGVYRGEELPMVMTMYLSVISRVLMVSADVFSTALSQLAHLVNEPVDNVLHQILNVWIHKMPLVTQLERRKLLGLALTTLLTAQSRPVLECFSGIMANIIEALNDVLRTDDINGLGNGQQIDSLIINVNISPNSPTSLYDLDDADYITEHDHRRKQLAATDPVHTIVLKDFLQVQTAKLREQIGEAQFQHLLDSLDDFMRQQFREHIGI
ncbi:importin-11 [Chrysoperla carnea]|uniref:importin-11 n=1 Tax=Chrysoperla carnea TaxID=189513 RepID=UPI001D06B9BC|nr:importin-11 [Chrysoperla carnea]